MLILKDVVLSFCFRESYKKALYKLCNAMPMSISIMQDCLPSAYRTKSKLSLTLSVALRVLYNGVSGFPFPRTSPCKSLLPA